MENENKKIMKFMSGKGFYAVLAICLIGAGAASWVAIDRTLSSLDNAPSDYHANISSSFFQNGDTNVDKPITDIKKPNVSTSSSQSSGQSSEHSNSGKSQNTTNESEIAQKQQFILPVSGSVIKEFSNHELVKSETLGDWRTHDGVDIKCDIGTEVLCVASGIVKEVKNDPLWGTVVTIEHNEVTSVYCGLEENVAVKANDQLERGDVIGTVGKNAIIETALEPHLHFELIDNSGYIDPVEFINK